MAFTRKMLKAMGIDDEKIDEIIEAHTEVTDSLKEQVKQYKADAEKLPTVEKELNDLKAKGDDGYKEKYEAEKKAHNDLKTEIANKESLKAKEKAYRELAKGVEGLSDTGIEKAVKYADYNKIELDKDGKIVDPDKHTEFIKSEWGGYKTQTTTQFNRTENPPANGGGKSSKTREEIMAMTDGVKRREAMYSNSHLFPELGIKKD